MEEKSILNVEVSCFTNYDTPRDPEPVNLLTWLSSRKYAKKVERIRAINDKTERDILKASLPAITPSGLFTYRNNESLIKHSGFIQFDIDFKGNENISNYEDLKAQIINITNVAYCGLSVSGKGFWGLIPIAYPEKHTQHFKALEEDFKSFGIKVDKACKDVTRLRGYSYDLEGYFNHSAKIYERYKEPEKPNPTHHVPCSEILSDQREIYNRLKIWEEKRGNYYADGNKHVFLISLAGACNRFGLDQYTVIDLLKGDFLHTASYVAPEDYSKIVESVYRAYSSQHGSVRFETNTSWMTTYTQSNQNRQTVEERLPEGWRYETFTRFDGVEVTNLINEYGYPAMWDN